MQHDRHGDRGGGGSLFRSASAASATPTGLATRTGPGQCLSAGKCDTNTLNLSRSAIFSEERKSANPPARSRSHTRLQGASTGPLDLSSVLAPQVSFCDDAALMPLVRQLNALEGKLAGHMMKMQEQREHSERMKDSMLSPLESKVATLEGMHQAMDSKLSELIGGAKGLEDAIKVQNERTDAAERRFRRWRKLLEEESNAKFLEFKQDVTNVVVPSAVQGLLGQNCVSWQDFSHTMDELRQEVRAMQPQEMLHNREKLATHQELADLAGSLKQQLMAIEEIVTDSKEATAERESEITAAAQSLRCELQLLGERKEETTSELMLVDLERASAQHRRSLSELEKRASRTEDSLQDAHAVVRRWSEDLKCMKAREMSLEVMTQPEIERIAQQTFENSWLERAGWLRRSILEQSHMAHGTGEIEAVDHMMGMGRWGETTSPKANEALVMATLRLDTVEDRVSRLQQEVSEAAWQKRFEPIWLALEDLAQPGTIQGRNDMGPSPSFQGWSWPKASRDGSTADAGSMSRDPSPCQTGSAPVKCDAVAASSKGSDCLPAYFKSGCQVFPMTPSADVVDGWPQACGSHPLPLLETVGSHFEPVGGQGPPKRDAWRSRTAFGEEPLAE